MQNKFIIWPAGTDKPWGSLSACGSVSAPHLGLCVLPEPQHWGLLECMGSTQESPGGEFALTGHTHSFVLGQDASPPELLAHSCHQKADFPALTRFEKEQL